MIANCETAIIYDGVLYNYMTDDDEMLTLGAADSLLKEKASIFDRKVG